MYFEDELALQKAEEFMRDFGSKKRESRHIPSPDERHPRYNSEWIDYANDLLRNSNPPYTVGTASSFYPVLHTEGPLPKPPPYFWWLGEFSPATCVRLDFTCPICGKDTLDPANQHDLECANPAERLCLVTRTTVDRIFTRVDA